MLPVLWIGVLAAPSALTRFDGLPFSSLTEAFAVAIVLPLALSAALRRVLSRTLSKCPVRVWFALLGAVIGCGVLKSILAPARPAGFIACYESTLTPLPDRRCERSFENPLFRFGATRVDRVIDFGPQDWNLSFFNSLRFNFLWLPGERRQDRLPFKVAWRGIVESGEETQAQVTYAGQGRVGIDARSIELPRAYDVEHTIPITLTPGRHVVRIEFSFDDDSRAIVRPAGPYATFRLTSPGPDGKPGAALRAAEPPAWLRAAALVVDAIAIGVSILLLSMYVRLLRFELRGAPIAVLLRRHRATRLLFAYFVLLLAGAWVALDAYPRLGTVVYRRAGEDWLTYESHARAILETRSLEGAESVFYMQPLFRYIRFAEHLLFGDGDPIINVLARTALYWTILWAASSLIGAGRIGPARTTLFAIAAVLTLALAGSAVVALMIELSLSEHATWIFTAAAFALLASRRPRRWAAGAAFLGAALITRPNQSPALLAIAVAFLAPALRQSWRPALVALSVLGGVCVLPLTHNLYYGGRAVFFTTTAGSPATLGIPASTLARTMTDATAREQTAREVRGLFFLPPWRSSFGHDEVRFVLYGLQAAWIAALWLAARRSTAASLRLLAVVPGLYLGVHLVYAVGNYYPRHIIAGHFAMGLVTMTIAARARGAPAPRESGTQRDFRQHASGSFGKPVRPLVAFGKHSFRLSEHCGRLPGRAAVSGSAATVSRPRH